MNIGEKIKDLRIQYQMNMASFSRETGLSVPTLKKVEAWGPDAPNISVKNLEKMCNALGAKLVAEVELINETEL